MNTTATAAATGNHPPHLSPARRNLRVIVWLAKPEWAFAAISLTFGIAFLIVTPPFQAADEEAHLRRAFEISEGRIVATKRGDRTGDELPAAIDALYDRFKGLKGHLEEKTTPAEIRNRPACYCRRVTAPSWPFRMLLSIRRSPTSRRHSASSSPVTYRGRCWCASMPVAPSTY